MAKRKDVILGISIVAVVIAAYFSLRPDGVQKIGSIKDGAVSVQFWGVRFGARDCVVAAWGEQDDDHKHEHDKTKMMFNCVE